MWNEEEENKEFAKDNDDKKKIYEILLESLIITCDKTVFKQMYISDKCRAV